MVMLSEMSGQITMTETIRMKDEIVMRLNKSYIMNSDNDKISMLKTYNLI